MPPEPVPWDRRDFRKHDRSSASDPRFGGGGAGNFGGGGPQRWRDQSHHHHAPPPHPSPYHQRTPQRWYNNNDFRSSSRPMTPRPATPGHGKQGSWHMYSDDAGHGYLPYGSRYGDRNFEEDSPRPFTPRSDGRYFRNTRENRGSFGQKEWKTPTWEPAASPSYPGRATAEVGNMRSVENTQTPQNYSTKVIDSSPLNRVKPSAAPPQPQPQPVLKDQQCKGDAPASGLGSTSQRVEKENGLGQIDWKPLKWSRSGSLSSRGSGLSHSSSSKSMGAESMEIVAEVQTKNSTPLQPPAVDAATCVSPDAPAPSGEATSRKKPRLGWGEGLAKFEKKKVDGPEDYTVSNGMAASINNGEILQSHVLNLADKSPRVVLLSDCASPSTPSSVACSSSPGADEKESIKSVNLNNDATKLSFSPSVASHDHYDGPAFNLENFDLSSIANLSSLIDQLLQSYDSSTTDTVYVQTSSMNKLVVWKDNVTKALVVTESEVDSLETELKSLIAESSSLHRPASSSSLPTEGHLAPREDEAATTKFSCRPPPLQVVSSGDMVTDNKQVAAEEVLKDEDFDSPGSATSKFVEESHIQEDILHSGTADGVQRSVDLDANNCNSLSLKLIDNGVSHKNYCDVDSSQEHLACSNGRVVVRDHESIWAHNKDCANRATEELYKLSPSKMQFDVSTLSIVSSLNKDSSLVKKKFLKRKRLLRFKEKVLSLKFKVFRHFWKEGRVLSVRKLRLKSHKKFDLAGHKKNRSSSRPRTSLSSGSSQTVPADEVIEFVNNLLSEMPSKPYRSSLKMPALVLDKKEKKVSRFISDNSLVVDPYAVEKERSMINPWSAEETEMFIDKLAAFGKDFKKIASFLDNKTTADCVQFYYKNHKSELFERARKKKPDSMKQRKPQSTTYMVASTKRWNRETNAASLDMLGAASAIAATVEDGTEVLKKCTSRFSSAAPSSHKTSKSEDGPLQRVNSLDTYNNEREAVAADVLAGICGSISSEAMSSCITSSVDPGDGYQDWRYQKVASSSMKRPVTPEVTQNIDDECSDESCGEMDSNDWTDEEKSIFIQAVSRYGKDFVLISQSVRTRTKDQCKLYYSKIRRPLLLDTVQPLESRGVDSGDINGGGSDVEDACDAEAGSDICNEGSGSKMEEDLPPCDGKLEPASDLKPDFMIEDNTNGPSNSGSAAGPVIKHTSLVQMDDKLVSDLNMNCKEPMPELVTMDMSSNTDGISPEVLCEAEKRVSVGVSEGQSGEESEGQHLLSPDENSNEKVDEMNANSSDSAVSCTVNELKSDPCVSHPSVGANSSLQVEEVSESQKKVVPETFSVETSRVLPLQENGHLDSMKSSTLFSVPIKYQRSPPHSALSASGSSRSYNNHSQNIALSDPVESLQILRGYPVSVQTKKQINCDLGYKRSVPLQNVPKQEVVSHSDRFALKKCSAPVHLSSIPEFHFASKEPSKDHSRPQSSGSSDVDRPPRNGDVKLFGKILTSAQPKASSSEQDDNGHKPGVQSLNLRLTGDRRINSDSAQSKFDPSNHIGAENVPVRNCGFWDGSRIQTGFSQVPDSTLLLTKYPAAFSNYSMHTMKLDPPPSSSVTMFSSNNGVENYPVLRNREVQPFTIDMQRRMGFDMISGMQPQARGMNVVGGRGVVSNGVSDPVAAIKMHYANASEQFSLQNGDETWRSNGDLGR